MAKLPELNRRAYPITRVPRLDTKKTAVPIGATVSLYEVFANIACRVSSPITRQPYCITPGRN